MATSLKVTRPNRLTNDETLTSFEDWKNMLTFYLNQDKDFAELLKETATWTKSSDADVNRGRGDGASKQVLDRFLGVIASLSPPLLYHEIIEDTTKVADIFRLLRSYYQFSPSESTFMKYYSIRREVVNGTMEKPLHLFLRMKQFIRDNLLLSSGKIEHDGKVPSTNETLSPTTERLNVLRWLEVLNPNLPKHVANIFAQDLQTKSLKDLQPRICEQIDDLLRQVADKEDAEENVSASYSRFKKSQHQRPQHFPRQPFQRDTQKPRASTMPENFVPNRKARFKMCEVCKSLSLPFVGHDIQSCPNISPADRSGVLKSFAVELDDDDDFDYDHFESEDGGSERGNHDEEHFQEHFHETIEIQRVSVMRSPAFNVKINYKYDVSATIDTGATGSMIQLSIVLMANLTVYPTKHSAEQADGLSHLNVVGEVHTFITLDDDLVLPISAVVVTELKEDILIGTPFLKQNKMVLDFGNDSIRVKDREILFRDIQSKPKTSLLKASVSRVVFPGDSVEFEIPANFAKDSELAIEPRDNLLWPSPQIINTNDGRMEVKNDTELPVKIKSQQVIAQLRSVVSPQKASTIERDPVIPEKKMKQNALDLVQIDPNNIMTVDQKRAFTEVNRLFSETLSTEIGCYNGNAGAVFGDVLLGNNNPIPKKAKVPSYNTDKNVLLQEKFDELIDNGVLKKPEEVGVDVVHTSPSFLVKNPDGSHRMVTSFTELNKYIHTLPTKLSTSKEVFSAISRWKYIIKTDLKSAYYQMKIADGAQKWLGTVSPFKGVFVYDRGSMGLRNMSEFLEELMSRIFGDYIMEGFMAKDADDLFIGGETIDELLQNWRKTLQRLGDNNLTLSAKKTVICPLVVKILGWIWKNGKIEADPHKTNPLTVCKQPDTVKQMRSFLGGFRVVSCCIPNYSTYLSELEACVAGKESKDKIVWTESMIKSFKSAQTALKNPKTITLPKPDDQLILVSDASNSPAAVGSTLYIKRKDKYHIGGFFSAKVAKHQLLWLPCEVEALGITLSINNFSHQIRESKQCTKFLTDSKPCVQAFELLSNGAFSLSPRVSSFLMNLNNINVAINHISGEDIPLTDFVSRNPIECSDNSCQVCQFVQEHLNIAVKQISVEEVVSGSTKMPFYNMQAWRDAQKEDKDLKRVYAQLRSGTHIGKKEKNLKEVRQLMKIASISQNGVLIRRKPNAFGRDYELIIIPQNLASGLISVLHIRLGHPTKTQFRKLWDRYFFAQNAEELIDECTKSCTLCESLKKVPRELFQQSTTNLPEAVGQEFTADVLRRSQQKLLVVLEKLSSFISATIIPSEKGSDLKDGLVQSASPLMSPGGCAIKVDNASGFKSIVHDKYLKEIGIEIDLSRVKNKNGNPTVDKAIQELEEELKRLLPEGQAVSPSTLATAVRHVNNRIRMYGLSAREIILKRESFTNAELSFSDSNLSSFKHNKRIENHKLSAESKARGSDVATEAFVNVGDIVHIKNDGSKHYAREFYLVVDVEKQSKIAHLQKFCGNQLRRKRYSVKLNELYKAPCSITSTSHSGEQETDSEEEEQTGDEHCMGSSLAAETGSGESTSAEVTGRASSRIRRKPEYLATSEIQRI